MAQPSDGFGPTAPAHPPVAPASSARRSSPRTLVVAAGGALLTGLLIGIAIGRATKGERAPAPPQPNTQIALAQLGVTSKPVEANVLVDGRFVGVSPVERLDLEPGKHSIVIDAFGYQPYAGTVEVEAKARATLKVFLAPVNTKAITAGEFAGAKRASTVTVPATALAPMSLTGTGTSKDPPKPAGGSTSRPSSASSSSRPPPRPTRDCSGEKRQCRDSCSSADSSCRFSCPGCSSCLTSVGWDECKRQCDACRQGCAQNVKFCETSCETQYSSCSASQ